MTKITFETNLKVTLKNTSYLKKTKLFFFEFMFFFLLSSIFKIKKSRYV